MIVSLYFIIPKSFRGYANELWKQDPYCSGITDGFPTLSFRLSNSSSEYHLLKIDASNYILIKKQMHSEKECESVNIHKNNITTRNGSITISFSDQIIEIAQDRTIRWSPSGLTGTRDVDDDYFSDISREVGRVGACSGFLVKTDLLCIKNKVQFVTADHCYGETVNEWTSRLTEVEKLMGKRSLYRMDFRDNHDSNPIRLVNTRSLPCEDVRVSDLANEPKSLRAFTLAKRLPEIGERVQVKGYANLDRPTALDCTYQGVGRIITDRNEISPHGEFHYLKCKYRIHGSEELRSYLGGMSGGPATFIDSNGEEVVFGVTSAATGTPRGEKPKNLPQIGSEISLNVFVKTMNTMNQSCLEGLSPSIASSLPADTSDSSQGRWITSNGITSDGDKTNLTFVYSKKTGCALENHLASIQSLPCPVFEAKDIWPDSINKETISKVIQMRF